MSEHRAPRRAKAGAIGAMVLAGLVAVGGGVGALSAASGSQRAPRPDSVAVPAPPSEPNRTFDPSTDGATPSPSPSGGSTSAGPTPVSPVSSRWTPSASKTAKPPKPRPSSTYGGGSGTGTAEQRVLDVINQARAGAGVAPLSTSSGLIASAHAHNLQMRGGCGLSHQCDGEDGLGDRISAQGVDWSSVAENIGDGGPVDDTEAAQAAMAVNLTNGMLAETPPDDGHRKNILNGSLRHIGIDVIRDSTGTVWLTQDFSS